MTDLDLMLKFMLQVVVVLIACRAVGWFGQRYLGQAQVTMQMLTGIILGPSVFGALLPKVQEFVFPQFVTAGITTSGKHPSMSILYVVAQIGLILCMFVVGLEFDLGLIKTKAKAAVAVSAAGIIFPFILGCGLFFVLLGGRTDMLNPSIAPPVAAIYVGAAMCITAFPVLARLISEAGIKNTSIGTLTLSAGAIDDVAAWSLLAVVLACNKGNPLIAIWAIGGGVLFVCVMLTLIKRVAAYLEPKEGEITSTSFGMVLVILFLGALFTDSIGIHAVFGAFIVGVAMPKGRFSQQIQSSIEPLAINFFGPFFFVYSGLNTKITSLSTVEHWIIAVVVLAAAIGGKLGGCYLAAKAFGESHRRSLAIGILMNSRGMMGLIILNIGLQQKIITTELFTIMVITAIVTTVMAPPLFRKVYRAEPETMPVTAQI